MAGAFSRAVKDISVRVGSDGERTIGRNAAMDGENNRNNNRYNNNRNDDNGGRWIRGGGFRGRARGRGRGGFRGRGNNRGSRGGGFQSRSRFNDNDEDGDSSMSERSSRRYGGGRRDNDGDRDRDRSPTSSSGWWKVIIPDGSSHDKDWLLSQLKRFCSVSFQEINVHNFKEAFVFNVNEETAAKALRKINNTITTRNGKISIIIKPSDPPRDHQSSRGGASRGGRGGNRGGSGGGSSFGGSHRSHNTGEVETDPSKIETLKEFLSNRYDVASIKLDLSSISGDQILRGANIDTRIWQPKLMNTILTLVNELCPGLKSLDISNNRVQRLDVLSLMSEKCPHLEELNLSNNQIRYLDELSKIMDCKKLTKLWFSNNPAKENYDNDDSGYVSAIRKQLPDIKELDGVVLPPPITFDLVANESMLPKSQKMYTCNKKASELVVNFLKNFFQIYDAVDPNDRQNLLQVYHNDAVFSLCSNNTVTSKQKQKGLNDYFKFNRNLKTIKDPNQKSALIKHKKLSVVALLTELPQTKHEFNSFLFDVSLVTPTCLMFTVHGIFLEGKDSTPRGFTRSFIAVPESESKFLIINDQLQIRHVTDKQLESTGQALSTQSGTGFTKEQQALLTRFSNESGMNTKYSLDCLSSNDWNFELAASKFNELKQSGGIPADAFIK